MGDPSAKKWAGSKGRRCCGGRSGAVRSSKRMTEPKEWPTKVTLRGSQLGLSRLKAATVAEMRAAHVSKMTRRHLGMSSSIPSSNAWLAKSRSLGTEGSVANLSSAFFAAKRSCHSTGSTSVLRAARSEATTPATAPSVAAAAPKPTLTSLLLADEFDAASFGASAAVAEVVGFGVLSAWRLLLLSRSRVMDPMRSTHSLKDGSGESPRLKSDSPIPCTTRTRCPHGRSSQASSASFAQAASHPRVKGILMKGKKPENPPRFRAKAVMAPSSDTNDTETSPSFSSAGIGAAAVWRSALIFWYVSSNLRSSSGVLNGFKRIPFSSFQNHAAHRTSR
mmetsp:Transcript_65176/g.131077  ORF Transcript_65176/g.131077 Transcript_65176/m.131077 type:complete len:335 (+) Transcript_65176:1169-2173(+)